MKKRSLDVLLLAVFLLLMPGCGTAGGQAEPTAAAAAEELSGESVPEETAAAVPPSGEPAEASFFRSEPAASQTPAPEPAASPTPPEETALTCSLWIRCDTILDHLDRLTEEKAGLVPESGVLLCLEAVPFDEGESVFDVLLRVTREQEIHLEFVDTPFYRSAYVEGIGNLYEFDCGELSGWSYKVNGAFPGCGCSLYELSGGDIIEWVYTCDLGKDVGGTNGWEDAA